MRMSAAEKRALPSSANLNATTETSDEDLEKKIGAAIHSLRNDRGMYRTQVASRLGMKETGVEVLCSVAPHLFGRTEEGALQMTTMIKILSRLNDEALTSVFKVIREFEPISGTPEN